MPKIFGHAPKILTTSLVNEFLKITGEKEGCFRQTSDEKPLFRERILEASKFIVSSNYQLSIIWTNNCHWATELDLVPELMGVLQYPEHPPLGTPQQDIHQQALALSDSEKTPIHRFTLSSVVEAVPLHRLSHPRPVPPPSLQKSCLMPFSALIMSSTRR